MDMLVKLYDLPGSGEIFAALSKEGIAVRRAMAPDRHKVVTFVKKEFSEAWASETEVAFARAPITCFIAARGRDLVGFANHDATCPNFFGPTGVLTSARSKGVGKALLFACLEDMRAQGLCRHRRRGARRVLRKNRRRRCDRGLRAGDLSRTAVSRPLAALLPQG
jgi:GNAT superfamily N-acetyltransferase